MLNALKEILKKNLENKHAQYGACYFLKQTHPTP